MLPSRGPLRRRGVPGALFPPLLLLPMLPMLPTMLPTMLPMLPTMLPPTTTSLPRHLLSSPTCLPRLHLIQREKKPLQRKAALADNHCQNLVEVHCPRKTSSRDSSPSWKTGVRLRPGFGMRTVPTPWRWHRHLVLVPPTRKAPCHRGTWPSSCHLHGDGYSSLKAKGQKPPRSRGTRSTTRRGCRGRQSCCARRWCGGRSRWLAQSRDPDFETCSDSCSVFPRLLPHCCTGRQHCCRADDFFEPRLLLHVVSSSSELCLDQCHFPPRLLPTVGQQGGWFDCALRGELGTGGRPGWGENPTLKASLDGEGAAAKAPANISGRKRNRRRKQMRRRLTDLVILVVFA